MTLRRGASWQHCLPDCPLLASSAAPSGQTSCSNSPSPLPNDSRSVMDPAHLAPNMQGTKEGQKHVETQRAVRKRYRRAIWTPARYYYADRLLSKGSHAPLLPQLPAHLLQPRTQSQIQTQIHKSVTSQWGTHLSFSEIILVSLKSPRCCSLRSRPSRVISTPNSHTAHQSPFNSPPRESIYSF